MSAEHATPPYRERLWPGPLGWGVVVGFAVFASIALVPVDLRAAAVAGLVTLAIGVGAAVASSPLVQVAGGELTAGSAHIPVALLGTGRALDRAGVRLAMGPGSDARAYVLLRSWLPGAVEIDVVDPADPTPTWLVSSRRPADLLTAIESARTQAAHSEQIG
ncbi:MAG: DUF3093 domain-containing protein [Cellulomonadaceae bacterium]|nr:DUF3093 domain-containing protein [Cellulomonadaceae bacterium]